MKLHWSPKSPFVRKVMITLHETGLLDEVECVRSVAHPILPPNPAIMPDNPLGKIPTLVTGDGAPLFDSRVICEYLDLRAGKGLFPTDLPSRMKQLRWQSLADGLTDVILAWRIELSLDGQPRQQLVANWRPKVRAGMKTLDEEAAQFLEEPFGIGQIALVCCLGQLDFRWADSAWRDHFPRLAKTEAELAKRPSVIATAVVDENGDGSDLTAGQLSFDQDASRTP